MGWNFWIPSVSKHHVLLATDDDDIAWDPSVEDLSQNVDRRRITPKYLMILTCSTGGLQVVWSLIMSNGTPFLITLGLPESLTALVWAVAPLCGVVQPYVGVMSDRCQNPWGRRRPYILTGAIGCVLSMLGLASTKPGFHFLARILGWGIQESSIQTCMLLSAIGWVLVLNVCIQPLQAGIRALIVDNCPARQQAEASAWSSRITGIGNIVGYLFGFIPVSSILPFLDISQFAWFCIVASIILSLTVGITCVLIQEKDPRTLPAAMSDGLSFVETIRHIAWSARTMPQSVSQVCKVQFFAWLGWFPYLFYISSYVGDLYAAPLLAADTSLSSPVKAKIIEDAVRLGSLASLVFAIFALITNVVLPKFIRDTTGAAKMTNGMSMTKAWSCAHVLFSISMFSTFFVRSHATAMILAAFVGISWAATLWIPFAIIGREVAARNEWNAQVVDGELGPAQQDQAGAVMGLHNCAISAPQILAALVSGIIFWLAPRDGIGWVMRFGGCSTLIAAWFAAGMDKQ